MHTATDISARINALIASLQGACEQLKLTHPGLSARDVEVALVDQLELEDGPELLRKDWTAKSIIDALAGYDFDRLHPEILEEISLRQSITPDGVPRLLTEERVKHRGEIWVIHKNDSDPFPSNPHAHNYATGQKLHLGNGMLYLKRREVGRVSPKNLRELRDRVRYCPLPPLEL